MMSALRCRVMLIAAAILASIPAFGRTHDASGDTTDVISLVLAKPSFGRGERIVSHAATLAYRREWRDGYRLLFDVPFAVGGFDGDSLRQDTEATIGNPFIGGEYEYRPDIWITAGLRLPLSSGNTGTFIGFYSDYSRFEAFADGRLSAMARVRRRFEFGGWTALEVWGGSVALLNPRSEIAADTLITEDRFDLVFDWGAQVWEGGGIRYGAGIAGRTFMSGEGSLKDRSKAEFFLAAYGRIGRLTPRLHLRLPLDDGLSSVVDLVVGARFDYALR